MKPTSEQEASGSVDYGAVSVRAARLEDAIRIAPLLREADRKEMMSLLGTTDMRKVLEAHIEQCRESYAVCIEGQPVALFGICPFDMGMATIGLLSTDELLKVKRPFLRHCRLWLESFNRDYPLLLNVVSVSNTVHVRWLKWLGFSFLSKKPMGVYGDMFYEFARLKHY